MKTFTVLMVSVATLVICSTCFAQKGTPLPSCFPNTVSITTGQAGAISVNHYDMQTFYTEEVCNATSYTWSIGGGGSLQTATPYVTLMGRDLVWLPPGGCDEFNSKWTSYNPIITYPTTTPYLPLPQMGYYQTTLSVKSNVSEYVTVSVTIHHVEKCYSIIGWAGQGGGNTSGSRNFPPRGN